MEQALQTAESLAKEETPGLSQELRHVAAFTLRLQFFTAAGLTLLILFFAAVFSPGLPLLPLMGASAWTALYTLILGYLAVAGSPFWLMKGRLLRIGLFLNILTVTIAAYLVREIRGDFYLLYLLPLITACVYYGLRGGLITALASSIAYYATAWFVGATADPRVDYVILLRAIFFFLCAGALGIATEGLATLAGRLQDAYANLRESQAQLRSLKEELERRAGEIQTIAQLSAGFVSTLSLDQVFSTVLDKAVDLFQADAASLMLLNPYTGSLEVKAVKGLQEALLAVTGVKPGEGIAGRVVAEGQPLLLQGPVLVQRPDGIKAPVREQIRSAMCVPLRHQGKMLGVLSLSSHREDRKFSEDDLRLLMTLADQTSLAIRNAQLYDQALRELEQVRRSQQARTDFTITVLREFSIPLQRLESHIGALIKAGEVAQGPGQTLLQEVAAEKQRLERVLDNLLGISALDTGLLQPQLRPVVLHPLIEIVVQEMQPRSARHSILVDLPADLPPVMGDVRSLAEAARLLIGNVIELTANGGTIRIDAREEKNRVLVNIGSGKANTAPEVLDDFFARFYAGDHTIDADRLGLQLFTAKALVEACGGKLHIFGGLTEGATFQLTLLKATQPGSPEGA